LRQGLKISVLCAISECERSLMYTKKSRAVVEKPHDAVVKFDSIEIFSDIALTALFSLR